MSNYCYNKLIIRGEHMEIQRFLKAVEGKDTLFDFNKLVPVPQELEDVLFVGTLGTDITHVMLEEKGYTVPSEVSKHLDEKIPFEKKEKTFRENAQLAAKCVEKYGYPCWGAWREAHWGTKVSASDTKIKWARKNYCYLFFTTTLNPPNLVIKEAISQFPNLDFKLKYKMEEPKPDENSIILGNGEFLHVEVPDGYILTEEKKEEIKKMYLEQTSRGDLIYAKHPLM